MNKNKNKSKIKITTHDNRTLLQENNQKIIFNITKEIENILSTSNSLTMKIDNIFKVLKNSLPEIFELELISNVSELKNNWLQSEITFKTKYDDNVVISTKQLHKLFYKVSNMITLESTGMFYDNIRACVFIGEILKPLTFMYKKV